MMGILQGDGHSGRGQHAPRERERKKIHVLALSGDFLLARGRGWVLSFPYGTTHNPGSKNKIRVRYDPSPSHAGA